MKQRKTSEFYYDKARELEVFSLIQIEETGRNIYMCMIWDPNMSNVVFMEKNKKLKEYYVILVF